MMVAVLLGALTLGACVDDNESQSVTDVRKAKAEQLSALAAKAKAEGEAALINASAEKAYKEAWAKYYEAQAKHQGALTDQVLQEIEQARITFEAELETLKAEYEARMWEAKKNAAKAEQDMLDQADDRLAVLYNTYFNALGQLNSLKDQKVGTEFDLNRYKANLVSVNEYVVKQTAVYQASIDEKNIALQAWKTYGGIDKAELKAQAKKLIQAQYTAFGVYQGKKEAAKAIEAPAEKALEVFGVDYDEVSTVAAVAALQKLGDLTYNYFLGYDYNSARNKVQPSVDKKLCGGRIEGDDQNGYIISNVMSVWNSADGKSYYVNPYIISDYISLSEDVDLYVPEYGLYSESAATFLTQYFAKEKDYYINQLGTPASDNKLATGLCLTKEQNEASLKSAQEALAKAETDFPVKEKAYKVASDAKDVAVKVENVAQKSYTDAVEAQQKAQEAYDKVVAAGGDTAATLAALNKAKEATTKASEALTKAQEALGKAQNAYYTAQNEYNTAQWGLTSAKKSVDDATLTLANTNDRITDAEKTLANWDENKTNWTAVVAALSGTKDAYKAAIEGLKTNKDVAAYITAAVAEAEAEKIYDKAVADAGVVSDLINNSDVKDPATEIRTLEKEIAGLNTQIAALKETYQNGLESANAHAKMIATAEATIVSLESQIEVKQAIVDLAKARVEAAIKAETPAN